MDEYAQIYWLDERNAGRDHRTPGGGVPAGWRPGVAPVVRAPATPASTMPVVRYPAQTVVAQPATVMMQPQPATYFGGLTLGQIIDMAAQALAAFQPLPAAPVATAEAVKDVGNLVLLCRARHKAIYADRRIMPRRSICSTEVHVVSAA